jgi:hypothetical protein
MAIAVAIIKLARNEQKSHKRTAIRRTFDDVVKQELNMFPKTIF